MLGGCGAVWVWPLVRAPLAGWVWRGVCGAVWVWALGVGQAGMGVGAGCGRPGVCVARV